WFMTPGISPEETTPEMPYYINCNGLAAEVYWQAFNFVSSGYRGSSFESSIRNEDVVFAFGKDYKKYAASGAQYFADQAEFLETLKKELLPGDQILAFKTNGEGHVMLFLGDCFGDGTDNVIHAWPIKGGKWDKATGVDKEEPYGAAWIQTAKDLLYEVGPSPNWPLGSPEKMQRVVVLRYLNNEKFLNAEFTDAAITRYNKQGLVVTKESTFDVYDTVLTGEEITITETLENHSAESYPVTVREYVAEGTAFVASSSTDLDPGTVSDNAVTWKVTVPAGGSVEVSYTVKVTADGYRELLFPAGAVSTLPTRELKTTVGKSRLTDEEIRTLQEKGLAAAEELAEGEFAGLGFLARFYEQVFGVQPAFPADLGEFLTALYEVKKPVLGADSRMLVRKEEPDEALLEFVIPRCELGDYYHNLNYLTNKDRIFTPKEAYFLPGDVLVEMHGANYQQYRSQEAMSVNVYLGGGKVLTYSAEGVRETTFEETFATASKYHYAVILRPMNGTER
ncbi:MAG: DUF11 domain-containing protein, partial [Lachnospiraceae bacterium]|nr:DUF11 domain-containing protein [Lachnospiraceae bacterium]